MATEPSARSCAMVRLFSGRYLAPTTSPRAGMTSRRRATTGFTTDDDPSLFAWAVGPGSPKSEFYPARSLVWRATSTGDVVTLEQPREESAPVALVGSRPCELAGMRVLDRVFAGGEVPDPRYRDRRESSFVVIAECGTPAGTCFCTSMGTGPGVADGAEAGYDLALTELTSSGEPRYLVRVGSERGAEVAEEMGGSPCWAAGPRRP